MTLSLLRRRLCIAVSLASALLVSPLTTSITNNSNNALAQSESEIVTEPLVVIPPESEENEREWTAEITYTDEFGPTIAWSTPDGERQELSRNGTIIRQWFGYYYKDKYVYHAYR
jgi:hypothetical protein